MNSATLMVSGVAPWDFQAFAVSALATIWLGLMAPKSTPATIVARLNAEVAKIVGNPETAKAWKAQGATPMAMTTAEFTRYLNDDIVKWAHIVKVSGAKPEQ